MKRRPKALIALNPEANLHTFGPGQRARLESLVDLVRATPIERWDEPRVADELAQIEILITGWGAPAVDRAILAAAPHLALIAHLAGSVKGLVDPAAWDRGILVTSAAAANAEPVAEFTLGAILLFNKRALQLRDLYREVRRSVKVERHRMPGIGNYRKTIGIIGASAIGRRVIELLAPFSFQVLLYDPYVGAEEAERLGVRIVELDTLVAESDVVSIHAPATPQTHHMIDQRRLRLMRDHAILINTARGSLVDQEALVEELRTGRIEALLDVTDPEPLPPDSPLYDLRNVFLTPHIAGSIGTEAHRLTESILREIERFVAGEPLAHPVRGELLERLA
ncbi:MAG TPA: hydroxyacid dehydrogenase [Candidatus Acidoferrales bacterium]|nr:hydroxyacid dehydrogenase [Candidatus Acidoferrales bacterium]